MSVFFDGEKLCVQLARGKDYRKVLELAEKYESEYLQEVGIFVFPPIKNIAKVLYEAGYAFDKSAEMFLQKFNKKPVPEIQVPETLYEFQKEGVKKMLSMNTNILLADEMGLGKTVQGAVYLSLKKNSVPALIICPASLKMNWSREIEKWTDYKTYIIEGRNPQYLTKEFIEKYPV